MFIFKKAKPKIVLHKNFITITNAYKLAVKQSTEKILIQWYDKHP